MLGQRRSPSTSKAPGPRRTRPTSRRRLARPTPGSMTMHIAPRLGGVKLRDLDPELVARFQADFIAEDVGPEARRKAMVLLGGILQRAAEARRIAYNPARLVRKVPVRAARKCDRSPRRRSRRCARPSSGAMRRSSRSSPMPAYGRRSPGPPLGARPRPQLPVNAEKTRTRRTVAAVRAARDGSRRVAPLRPIAPPFAAALRAAGVSRARPYDLRHSFASLLLHEGRSVIYVARQLGPRSEPHDEHLRARHRGARKTSRTSPPRRRSAKRDEWVPISYLSRPASSPKPQCPELDSNQRPTP